MAVCRPRNNPSHLAGELTKQGRIDASSDKIGVANVWIYSVPCSTFLMHIVSGSTQYSKVTTLQSKHIDDHKQNKIT